jgi:hypothetical protein
MDILRYDKKVEIHLGTEGPFYVKQLGSQNGLHSF